MFIKNIEKEMINDRLGFVEEDVEKQKKRIADLEAIIETLTDLFSVEINQRVGKKAAELTKDLSEKLGDALKELDKTFGKIVKEGKKKTTKTAPATKKVGRPKKETK